MLALVAAWMLRPTRPTPFSSSAPSRITSFLKKRRMRSRIVGAILMALAIVAIFGVAYLAFARTKDGIQPIFALPVVLVADTIYFGGRKLWQRLG